MSVNNQITNCSNLSSLYEYASQMIIEYSLGLVIVVFCNVDVQSDRTSKLICVWNGGFGGMQTKFGSILPLGSSRYEKQAVRHRGQSISS